MDLVRAGMVVVVPLVRAALVDLPLGVHGRGREPGVPARARLVDPRPRRGDDLPLANGLVLGSSYGTIPFGAGAVRRASPRCRVHDLLGRPSRSCSGSTRRRSSSRSLLHRAPHAARPDAGRARRPTARSSRDLRFRDAFRIPLVRAVMPAALAVALGLGALFSLGIVFVRDVLHASDARVRRADRAVRRRRGAGLAAVAVARPIDDMRATRIGVAALGVIVALFSLAPVIGLAFIGAVAFGAGAAWTLASGMGALQSGSKATQRVLAFSAFHVVIRCRSRARRDRRRRRGRSRRRGALARRRHARSRPGSSCSVRASSCCSTAMRVRVRAEDVRVTVAIVTDSAAALPANVVDALGVTVVPMWLQLGGTARHEDEVDLDELIVHRDISTSGPTPGEFETVLHSPARPTTACACSRSRPR